MAEPTVGALAEEVLADAPLSEYQHAEADNDWPLKTFIGAILDRAQEVADLARDSDDGIGWSAIVDPDRAPEEWLPWTAQLVGVRIPPPGSPDYSELDEAQKRIRIKETDGQKRGTPAAMMGAARTVLGGERQVWLIERHGSPYRVTLAVLANELPSDGTPLSYVTTYGQLAASTFTYEEIPEEIATYQALIDGDLPYEWIDSALLLRTVTEQKPAGLILNLQVITGEVSYDALRDTQADYADVLSTFADYAEVLLDPTA